MLGVRFPLFSKIMIWFFLNLVVVIAAGSALFYVRMESRTRQVFAGPIEGVIRAVESESNTGTRETRDEALRRQSEKYAVDFYLFDATGNQLGGAAVSLPEKVYEEVTRFEPMPGPRPPEGNQESGTQPFGPPRAAGPGAGGGPPPSVYLTTTDNKPYWYVGRVLLFDPGTATPVRGRVVVASTSFTGNGLFLNITPFVLLALGIFGFSILFWFPFVRSMTVALSQMKKATKRIADEKFDIRVDDSRTDELGELGESINQMASRLDGFVTGQKRFLGDVSHELNSPLARMQFALSILEENTRPENQARIADVKEEVEVMTKLVNELLSYSKTGIRGAVVTLEPVAIREIVEHVVEREASKAKNAIDIDIDEDIRANAQPELVYRAVANVVRNSLVYAGENGRIRIAARNGGGNVVVRISDDGPGVPASTLEKIFDPLFRVESHRSRNTGGSGLGLAIVKTCIETCNGSVSARNIAPHGLEISLTLGTAKPVDI